MVKIEVVVAIISVGLGVASLTWTIFWHITNSRISEIMRRIERIENILLDSRRKWLSLQKSSGKRSRSS